MDSMSGASVSENDVFVKNSRCKSSQMHRSKPILRLARVYGGCHARNEMGEETGQEWRGPPYEETSICLPLFRPKFPAVREKNHGSQMFIRKQ